MTTNEQRKLPLLNTTLQVEICGGNYLLRPPISFPFLLHREKGWPHPFSASSQNAYSSLFDERIRLKFNATLENCTSLWVVFEWGGIDGTFEWKIGEKRGTHAGGQRPLRVILPRSQQIACEITIPPQREYLRKLADAYGSDVPALFEKLRVFSRTPSCYFGWDWAPAIFPFGVREMPGIREWLGCEVLSAGFLDNNDQQTLTVFVESDEARIIRMVARFGETLAETSVVLKAGLNKVSVGFENLGYQSKWIPGKQNKGTPLDIQLYEGVILVDSFCCMTLRKDVTLLTDGVFDLRSNGISLSRGANYVEPFFPDCEAGPTDEEMLSCLLKAGGNIIRVWGGGRYASQSFLSCCDRLGIAVWQDMPFACGCCPADTWEGVYRDELIAFLVRSAHHPSLSLICGGNENEWLFGAKRTEREREFFLSKSGCKAHVSKLRPDLIYWPDSPYGEGKPNGTTSGDTHEWEFWSGRKPIEVFSQKDYLYVSEFGFQSAPSEQVLLGHLDEQDLVKAMQARQFQEKGEKILEHYVRTYCPSHYGDNPVSASRYSQAFALGHAVRMMSYNKSFNGALVWQLNDVVPAVSWSLIDIAGIPKPSLGALNWAWSNPSISLRVDERGLRARAIGMSGSGTMSVTTISDRGIASLESAVPHLNCEDGILLLSASQYEESNFIRLTATCESGKTASYEWWKSLPRLGDTPAMRFSKRHDMFEAILTSTSVAVLLLESNNAAILPTQNPVTVLQGEERRVPICCSAKISGKMLGKTVWARIM